MKKIIILLFIALVVSCSEIPEFEFSCDPLINEYVSDNLYELSEISLDEFNSYNIRLQRAIFRSFDDNKKRDFWLQKLQYLIDSNNYSENEINHIIKLMDFIDQGIFQLKELEDEEYQNFVSDWRNHAKNELGWSDNYIAFVAFRLYTNQFQFDSELSLLKSIQNSATTNSETGSCNCNQTHDFCPGSDCISSNCSSTSSGCGFLMNEDCDGVCD